MARLSPEEGFELLKDRVSQTIGGLFPIVGKKHTLELKDVNVADTLHIDDIRSQKETKLAGRSWAVPVEATITLKDNKTGKPVDQQTVKLLSLPKQTRRYSYIVDGQERQIDNQWRLKSGVYARIKDNGELQSQFNLSRGRGFSLGFDPESRKFTMKYGTSNIPLLPLLHAMDVPHEEIDKRWGTAIATANHATPDQTLLKFYKAASGKKAGSPEEAKQFFRDTFAGTALMPETTRITLGKEYSKVTGPVLLDAATKLLHISQGKAQPDSRDSLMFKELHSTEDFVSERIRQHTKDIMRKLQNNLDRKRKVREIVGPDIFQRPVQTLYTRTSLSNSPEQTNPLEMMSGQMKTTITGEGGIKKEHSISEEAKLVDPSHLGFLDPIHTPEGPTTGVTLRLPIGAEKRGHDVIVKMYNLKTGRLESVNPEKAMTSNFVLPDQVTWKGGKPVPVSKTIKISGTNNDIFHGTLKDAQYVMRDPIQMFSMASNLIPFMPADHPNRSTMAGRHMEQAIPLAAREEPLVQARAGRDSFDKIVGAFAGHNSRLGGKVVGVTNDAIHIKDEKGKVHEHQIYDHFPLNADKSFLHSTPLVKVGDTVGKGQPIADTNFTKNGTLALGTNLRVGYMPYKGYNFEDGVVISETAANKLASEHLHRKSITLEPDHVLSKAKFQAYVPQALTRDQAAKLDTDGIIKPGMTVMPGDTLIAALRNRQERVEDRELARLHKTLIKPYDDKSVKWDADHLGVVTEVIKKGKEAVVHVKTLEAAEIGDKLAGRHGNKGIITKIVPDHEMPKTKGGDILHVLMNPTGVPGRVNIGQVLETAAGKIAEKTGKTYLVKNFEPNVDLHAKVTADLKAHGLTDKEVIIDPLSGRTLGEALVGPQHIIKLKHQVEKKLIARAGGPGYAYDRNFVPKGGGPHGAQALGQLGLYSMLAHGAKANLREMQTIKSDAAQSDEFWAALQAGEPLPAPRPTFAYNKFVSYLNVLGLNVKKEGNNLQLIPFTDKQILSMSNGAIKDAARMVRAKDLQEEKGGLFDPDITGGHSGTKWAHIKLPEPYPNPVFERAIQTLTGLKGKEYDAIIEGKLAVNPTTGALSHDVEHHLTAGRAFEKMLSNIDVKKELAAAQKSLDKPGLKGNRLDNANKKVKYLTALKDAGLTAQDAYITQYIPVIPPIMRPLSQRPDGEINYDDLNHMYKGISLSASRLAAASPLLPQSEKAEIRADVYDGLRSLTGLGGHLNREARGVLDIIQGYRPEREGGWGTGQKVGTPKSGFFQKKLTQRKQDLSMRSTIIPEPAMGLDEVGLPRSAALEIYKPFVIREIRGITGMPPLEAQKHLKEGGPLVNRALERVMETRPVLLKRDPVLHKYGIQAFKPRIVQGKAVQIHPLVTSGFNADFDGDAMSAFVPVGAEAVAEAYKMFPSKNLFSPSTGDIMYRPTLESQLGLYGITRVGDKTNKSYTNFQEMQQALNKGDIKHNDQIKVGGLHSTVGRFLLAGSLPEPMRRDFLTSKTALDKRGQEELLTQIGREHHNDYGAVVNKLKDLGNDWSTNVAFSLGLEDVKPEKKLRAQVMDKADAAVANIQAKTQHERDAKTVQIYDKATTELQKKLDSLPDGQSNLLTMYRAGIKPGKEALRQIKMAPMLIANAKGEIIPTPVRRSYSEGLDIADYWTSMSGARKGIIQKVQQVQEPGHISKQVMNSVMNNLIISDDCGTTKGIALSVDEKDILDRHLAADVKAGKKVIPAGTLITPEIRSTLRNNKVGLVPVRSPLRCEHGPGICKKCYGLSEDGRHPEIGTNVGVLAGQALGERSSQLAMKAFHTGGTAASKETLVDEFDRVQKLLLFPKTLPGSATLSTVNGKVEKIERDPAGGHSVFIGGQRHYIPQNRGLPLHGGEPLKVGAAVKKGAPISAGPANPHEMLPLTGIEPVQGYLAGALHDIYGAPSIGIRRRNTEVVVKALTNLTKIDDPGDHPGFIRGDFAPTSHVANINRQLPKGANPILHTPVLRGVNVMPLDMHEDWLAKMNHEHLRQTVIDAAQEGWVSHLHGVHPIPPVVHGTEIGKGKKPWEY
jgi:DNA-directed RNA polymerase subunit beta'